MSQGQNKRVVKKEKNKDTMNIKISTQDPAQLTRDNEIKLSISPQKKNQKKGNSSKSKSAIDKTGKEKENDIENRISKLIEQNYYFQKELDSIQSKIKSEAENGVSKISSLNEQLAKLEKEQIMSFNQNKNYLSKLKEKEEEVTKRFEDKFKISKVLSHQKKEAIKPDFDKQIEMKEIEKENIQKLIKYNQKEVKKLEKLLEENKEGSDQKLADELKEINEKINEVEKEIEKLKKVKLEHKNCEKDENILKGKLNVLSNEFEFESKKLNMIETEKKEPTKIKNVNMTMEYGERVRKQLLQNTKIKYNSKMSFMNYKSYNFFLKELDDNRKSINMGSSYKNLKTIGDSELPDFTTYLKKDISCRIDTKSPKNFLFSDQEKEVLKKLLPNEYYNNYNEKYSQAENKINELEEKFKNHEQIKREINLDNIKCDAVNLKIKELSTISANLKINLSKNTKKIADIKKRIQSLNDEIYKQKTLISKKKQNNNLLKKKIDLVKKEKEKEMEKLMQTDE